MIRRARAWAGALMIVQAQSAAASASTPVNEMARIEQRERQGDHDGAARGWIALLASPAARSIDRSALVGRADHVVTLVRAARSDREGFAACEQLAARIEDDGDSTRARAALSLRLRCAESELAALAERRRAAGPVGPELYAIERESRSLAERLVALQTDARSLRSPVESVLATALVGRASGLLGDEAAANRSAVDAARAWAEMVDVSALLAALPAEARPRRARVEHRVADAPVLVGRARGPSDRERALRASVGDALVERTWSAVVELVWISIERDRRAVTSARIEPLARAANELRRERWYSSAVGPVLDRHRALLEPAMLSRYEALWSADATSARFAAALRVGELFMDFGERNRAVQDTLIERSSMAAALRGYVSPVDQAYLQQARGVFERCVSEAQRAGVDNAWVRACGQHLRRLGASSGVVLDELVPAVSSARSG